MRRPQNTEMQKVLDGLKLDLKRFQGDMEYAIDEACQMLCDAQDFERRNDSLAEDVTTLEEKVNDLKIDNEALLQELDELRAFKMRADAMMHEEPT